MRTKLRGFTLLEMMIVVAVIGVLASVALPAYQRSVLAGGRAEGQILLLQLASAQEQFYTENNRYSSFADPFANADSAVRISPGGLYQVAVAACAGGTLSTCFVATATPLGRQREDACSSLTISNIGFKGATGATVVECWR